MTPPSKFTTAQRDERKIWRKLILRRFIGAHPELEDETDFLRYTNLAEHLTHLTADEVRLLTDLQTQYLQVDKHLRRRPLGVRMQRMSSSSPYLG